jgi:hypothetical protein
MLITKRSSISGEENTLDLDINAEQLMRIQQGKELIQNIVPHLSKDQREFLITGITADEWDNLFGNPEDDEDPWGENSELAEESEEAF